MLNFTLNVPVSADSIIERLITEASDDEILTFVSELLDYVDDGDLFNEWCKEYLACSTS
jgi:hypothetical protein